MGTGQPEICLLQKVYDLFGCFSPLGRKPDIMKSDVMCREENVNAATGTTLSGLGSGEEELGDSQQGYEENRSHAICHRDKGAQGHINLTL